MGIFDWLGESRNKRDSNVIEFANNRARELTTLQRDVRHKKMYTFVHVAIRDAVMQNHPELVNDLNINDSATNMFPLLHFWSGTLMMLEREGIVDMDDEDEFDVFETWTPFSEMSIEHFHEKGHRVSVVTFPQPQKALEVYMCAIVHQDNDELVYDGSRGNARYFTLEYAGPEYPAQFCEWDGDEHVNYGDEVEVEQKAFARAVLDKL